MSGTCSRFAALVILLHDELPPMFRTISHTHVPSPASCMFDLRKPSVPLHWILGHETAVTCLALR